MKLVIRKATSKDIPSMVKVRRAAFTAEEVQGFTTPEPSVFYYPEKMKEAWNKDNRLKDDWRIYVAEANEVVGFIVFRVETGIGYIENINIAKDQQRRGVGKALVKYVEQIAKSEGAHIMHTDTTENVEGIPWKSYAFWTKMGYKDTGERITTEWSFKEIRFVKKLQ
jgi:ribosomal protein S18 acetylase RimI-like enzyme